MQAQAREPRSAQSDERLRLERVTMQVALVLGCLICGAIALRPDTYQWDFATFYYAAKAWLHGLNPYLLPSLTHAAGRQIALPFLYPLISLIYFIPFTLFPYSIAWYLWLGLKLAGIIALTTIWRRYVIPSVSAPLLVVLLMLGLGSTVWCDLVSGNVAIYEQLLLWIGIAGFLHRRRVLFVTGIVLAATLKWTPLIFLGLALLPSDWRGSAWKTIAAGLSAFFLVGIIPQLLNPQLTVSMFTVLRQVREVGASNPCAFALLDHLQLLQPRLLSNYRLLRPVLLLLYYGSILSFSVPVVRRLMHSDDRLALVLVCVAIYVVLLPRCKCYSYIALIPTVCMLLQTVFTRGYERLLALAVVCLPIAAPADRMVLEHAQPHPLWVLASYYVWFVALAVCWISSKKAPITQRRTAETPR